MEQGRMKAGGKNTEFRRDVPGCVCPLPVESKDSDQLPTDMCSETCKPGVPLPTDGQGLSFLS